MAEVKKNSWDLLDKVETPFGGMLKCLYEIRFTVGRELNDSQKDSAFRCLNIIAEDENNDKDVRAWCYNQLGNIHSGRSYLIPIK